VSPSGDLEPCPAAPLSDANLGTVPLKEALRSRLLARLREAPEVLTESEGGCALRANRVLVQEIIGYE
jgi:MoaA/NifB/PqqE/SkfB family radical SAM enzyme